MQTKTPSGIVNQDEFNKSVNTVLNGNVSPGNGLTFDTHGQPLTFNSDNQSGLLVRIAAVGNPVGAPAAWVASNTDLTIAHNLNKLPYGYVVIAKSKTCDVYWGSINPTKKNITLRCTDATADVTLFIMV